MEWIFRQRVENPGNKPADQRKLNSLHNSNSSSNSVPGLPQSTFPKVKLSQGESSGILSSAAKIVNDAIRGTGAQRRKLPPMLPKELKS